MGIDWTSIYSALGILSGFGLVIGWVMKQMFFTKKEMHKHFIAEKIYTIKFESLEKEMNMNHKALYDSLNIIQKDVKSLLIGGEK